MEVYAEDMSSQDGLLLEKVRQSAKGTAKAVEIAAEPVMESGLLLELVRGKTNRQQPRQEVRQMRASPTTEFSFKRGDIRGNVQKLLNTAESPDYVTMAGGKKAPEITGMTVEQIGKKYGNKAIGRYQIQYETAIDTLKRAKLNPAEYRFDEAGQDRLYDLLLKQRGKIAEYRAGKISREQVAKNLSTIWAGLPKDASGKSYYEGVGDNKAHVAWQDVLLALE